MCSGLVPLKNLEKADMWRSIFKVPVSGQDFGVTIKLSRWMSPGKRLRAKIVTSLLPIPALLWLVLILKLSLGN